jgi:hypothetical protein
MGPYYPPIAECTDIILPPDIFHPYGSPDFADPFSGACVGIPAAEETVYNLEADPPTTHSSKYPFRDYSVVIYDNPDNPATDDVVLLSCGSLDFNTTGQCSEITTADVRLQYDVEAGRLLVRFVGGRRGQTSQFNLKVTLADGNYKVINVKISVTE